MNLFTALKTLWRYRDDFKQLGQALSEAERGQYQLARQTAEAVLAPPLIAAAAGAGAAALDYSQEVVNGLLTCMNSGTAPLVCFHQVNWRANLIHLGVIVVGVFITGLKLYKMKPKEKPPAQS